MSLPPRLKMALNELQKHEKWLKEQCLILEKKVKALDIELKETKESIDFKKEKINGLDTKLVEIKGNLALFLGYCNDTTKQVEIEEDILTKFRENSKKIIKEFDEKIELERNKLNDAKFDNKDFLEGLGERDKSLKTKADGLEEIRSKNEKNQQQLKISQKGNKIWEALLKKQRKDLDSRDESLTVAENRVGDKLNEVNTTLKNIESNKKSAEENLAKSERLVKSNKVKRQEIKLKLEAVEKDKKELVKREQRIEDEKKKMASRRASLRSAIYEHKRLTNK